MKVARVPYQGGQEIQMAIHDLAIYEARLRRFRPIHALTYLAQFHKSAKDKGQAFWLGLTLENKLSAVAHYLTLVSQALTPMTVDLYPGHYVREYDPVQRLIALIEGYVGAVYSSLEVVALLNKQFNSGLPQGFRRQAKKFELFSLAKRDWLPHFYDVRSELAHYNSPIPIVEKGKLVIEFKNPSQLEVFSKGRHEIGFDAILGYAAGLFDMLDEWSMTELKNVEMEASLQVLHETGWKKPLEAKTETVSSFLNDLGIQL